MRIIETRTAPNPRRVRIFLAEKGVSVPFEERSLADKALQTPEFTRLNPMQRVPVLVLDDGTIIAETLAICRYFEEMQPEPALFGRGAVGRAQVEMWNRRAELGHGRMQMAEGLRDMKEQAELEVPQIAAWGEANRAKTLPVLEMLDARLGESRYLAGEEYSVADITALVAIDFMKPARIERPARLVNLNRWHGEVSSRPSAAA